MLKNKLIISNQNHNKGKLKKVKLFLNFWKTGIVITDVRIDI